MNGEIKHLRGGTFCKLRLVRIPERGTRRVYGGDMSETEVKEEENTIRLGEIFHMLWKNKILIAIITAVVFLIGVIYTFWVVEPQYRSSSMVLVAVTQQSTSTGNEGAVDYTNSLRVVNTVARLVQEDVVLDPVAEEFDLSSSGLSGMISVSSDEDSFIIIISVECGDSTLSMELANALAGQLVETMEMEGFVDLRANLTQTSTAKHGVYSSPNKPLYLVIAFVGGLVLGCIVALVLEFCSTKFRSRKDIESGLGERVVGFFVDDKMTEGHKLKGGKGDVPRPHAALLPATLRNYEPYNKLFTNIKYANVDNPYKVIMVTSSQECELKSTIVANFACALAYNAQRVLLIDMDLRKSAIHKLFKVSREHGIVDYVAGKTAKESIIKHTSEKVDVITAGSSVLNPLVIIESVRFGQLLGELRQQYDYILLDTPPVLACSDACAISKVCDGVLFNLSIRDTKKKQAALALATLQEVDADVIGVNVTKATVDKHGSDAYYYYYSNSGYYSKDMTAQTKEAGKSQSSAAGSASKIGFKSRRK